MVTITSDTNYIELDDGVNDKIAIRKSNILEIKLRKSVGEVHLIKVNGFIHQLDPDNVTGSPTADSLYTTLKGYL